MLWPRLVKMLLTLSWCEQSVNPPHQLLNLEIPISVRNVHPRFSTSISQCTLDTILPILIDAGSQAPLDTQLLFKLADKLIKIHMSIKINVLKT